MLDDGYTDRARAVIMKAFDLGRSSGVMGPLHLLVALSEDDGTAATLLRPAGVAGGVRRIVFGDRDREPIGTATMADFRASQVMGSAGQWATTDDTKVDLEHLLLALVEQADPEVIALCVTHAIDLAAARQRAMDTLDWLSVPPLLPPAPAGTMDRPPLPLELLPDGVWAELVDRQRRLPIGRLRHEWHAHALCYNEDRAARRITEELDLNDDERYSLLHYHREAVRELAGAALPAFVRPSVTQSGGLFAIPHRRPRRLRRWYRRRFFWLRGWACWFGNRRAGLRDRWFRLTWRY